MVGGRGGGFIANRYKMCIWLLFKFWWWTILKKLWIPLLFYKLPDISKNVKIPRFFFFFPNVPSLWIPLLRNSIMEVGIKINVSYMFSRTRYYNKKSALYLRHQNILSSYKCHYLFAEIHFTNIYHVQQESRKNFPSKQKNLLFFFSS